MSTWEELSQGQVYPGIPAPVMPAYFDLPPSKHSTLPPITLPASKVSVQGLTNEDGVLEHDPLVPREKSHLVEVVVAGFFAVCILFLYS
jgi:hypothetical protein